MTKDEALKLALEALKRATNYDPVIARAITAIKETLAQHDSVQEKKSTLTPKFVRIIDGVTCISLVEHEHIVNSLSQPEQEPVAWRFTGIAGLKRYMTQKQYDAQTPEIKKWYEPFKCKNCTTPPQPEQEPVALPLVQFEKVAEGIEVGYDVFGGVDIRLGGEFVYVHINYDYRYTHNAERKALAKQIVGLLTTPPQRKPLTKDGTMEIANQTAGQYWMDEAHIQRFRAAVEAAHGIKENT